MKAKHLLTGMAATAAGLLLISYLAVWIRERRMLKQVADEGYETASDILFPDKKSDGKLRYGPVLPTDPQL